MSTLRNPRFLNAEDDATLDALEIAVDLAMLDPAIEVGVLRGGDGRSPDSTPGAGYSAPGST